MREQVGDRLDVAFEDMGEQKVKNIARPIRVYRSCSRRNPALASAGAPDEPSAATKPSLVVLPFVNMSGDPEQEFFVDGLTEDIITELSRFRELLVISRNSAFVYKGKAVKVQDIARELGVHYVVEGSVRKAGDRVRVTVQLIDAETDRHVWAERYDRKIEDIFAIQDEMTARSSPRFPAASRPPATIARSASRPRTWRPMNACWPARSCTTARRAKTTPRRSACSIARSRSTRNMPTRMRGRPACWPGMGLRLVRRPQADLELVVAKRTIALGLDDNDSDVHRILAAVKLAHDDHDGPCTTSSARSASIRTTI